MTEEEPITQQLFFYAAKTGDVDTLKGGIGQFGSSVDELGNNALHWSASAGHLDCVKFLIENKIDVNGQNHAGESALHKAVWKGHEDIVKFLVEDAECEIEIKNKAGETPGDIAKHLKIKAYLESFVGDDDEDDEDEEEDD